MSSTWSAFICRMPVLDGSLCYAEVCSWPGDVLDAFAHIVGTRHAL